LIDTVDSVSGFVLEIIGVGLAKSENINPVITLFGVILFFIDMTVFMKGFALYAMAKGRHPAWCLMALFSWIGLIVLALLKDKAPYGENKSE